MIEKLQDRYFKTLYRYIKAIKDYDSDYAFGYASAEFRTTREWLASLMSAKEFEEYEKTCLAKMVITFDIHLKALDFLIK